MDLSGLKARCQPHGVLLGALRLLCLSSFQRPRTYRGWRPFPTYSQLVTLGQLFPISLGLFPLFHTQGPTGIVQDHLLISIT